MEEGEWGFCSMWTEAFEPFCGRLLLNKSLAQDYFFNRCSLNGCRDLDREIQKLRSIRNDQGIEFAVYERSDSLAKKDLALIDVMYTLVKPVTEAAGPRLKGIEDLHYEVIEAGDDALRSEWGKVFCRSFEVPHWSSEVLRITNQDRFRETVSLKLARSGEKFVGCLAAHSHRGLAGLYCLGTLPEWRRMGAATALLRSTTCEGAGQIYLQALRSEQNVAFYEREGFVVKYSKSIYSLNSHPTL
jgi:ribosomal protein S18 acetylase RimI-like enzyme